MNQTRRRVLILRLIEKLKENGSWCGETHVQKAVYFFQKVGCADMEYDFILYKHGPFAFDLRDELTSMRADGLLGLQVNPMPYGPTFVPTDHGKEIMGNYPRTLARHKPAIDFVAVQLGDKGVTALERLATALYVTKNGEEWQNDVSVDDRARKIIGLKSHISYDEAKEAVECVDRILNEANELN